MVNVDIVDPEEYEGDEFHNNYAGKCFEGYSVVDSPNTFLNFLVKSLYLSHVLIV